MTARVGRAVLLLVLASPITVAASQPVLPAQASEQLTLRAGDVLNVVVAGQPDLSKSYSVEPDGTFVFPLVGALQAAGLTVDEITAELQRHLSEFIKDPKNQIKVERSKRVCVFGGVASPGMYQLTAHMRLMELPARAGYGAAPEVVIVRNRGAAPPASPDGNASSDVIRINLREFEKDLESGELSRNVVLEDGDTIYVPRFDPNRMYVSGEVRNPGAYSVPEGTTVLLAMTLAAPSSQEPPPCPK